MKPLKLHHIIIILLANFLFCTSSTLAKQNRTGSTGGSTAITVVSDTTDNGEDTADQTDTTFYVAPSVKSIQIVNPDLTSRSFWKVMFSKDGPFSMLGNMLDSSTGLFFILSMLFILFIFFLPVLLVVLVIILLVRDNRRKKNFNANHADAGPQPEQARNKVETGMDKAVKHILAGIGATACCYYLGWKILMLLSIVLLCWGIGEFINVKRKEKNNK